MNCLAAAGALHLGSTLGGPRVVIGLDVLARHRVRSAKGLLQFRASPSRVPLPKRRELPLAHAPSGRRNQQAARRAALAAVPAPARQADRRRRQARALLLQHSWDLYRVEGSQDFIPAQVSCMLQARALPLQHTRDLLCMGCE